MALAKMDRSLWGRECIKPSKPPCFKKPLTVLRAGSYVLSHCEQFWAESSVNNKNFLELIRARHKHLVPVLHLPLYVRMSYVLCNRNAMPKVKIAKTE